MKIIGRTVDGYILQASDEEVCQVIGYETTFHYEKAHRNLLPGIGTQINVSPLFKALVHERNRPTSIASLARGLRSMADTVESMNAALETAIVEPEAQS